MGWNNGAYAKRTLAALVSRLMANPPALEIRDISRTAGPVLAI